MHVSIVKLAISLTYKNLTNNGFMRFILCTVFCFFSRFCINLSVTVESFVDETRVWYTKCHDSMYDEFIIIQIGSVKLVLCIGGSNWKAFVSQTP